MMPDVYLYQAGLLCEDCGEATRRELDANGQAPIDTDNEHTYDSGDYPKGPYPDGGGEADCPQHCDMCNEFLDNPLTLDGEDYVREIATEGRCSPIWYDAYRHIIEDDDQ